MGHTDLLGRTFDGYRLTEVVAVGDDEVLYGAERARDGDRVWIRTARDSDPAARGRLEARYVAELDASRRLAGVDAVLPVRETIDIDGAPALVTDRPRGRSLHDVLSEQTEPFPIKQVMVWFDRLSAALEAAHADGAAHGSLQPRAIYLDPTGLITLCGVASMPEEVAIGARRADVRSLATLLYRATTARLPSDGVNDAGVPVSPEAIVFGYPVSLARFLRRRLFDDDPDDPVDSAGVFRRSIHALEVDPTYRRAVGLERPSDGKVDDSDALGPIHPESRVRWVGWGSFISIVLVGISVSVTMALMEQRVDAARLQASPLVVPPAPQPAVEPRLELWTCLHQSFLAGGPAVVTEKDWHRCQRKAPLVTREALAEELARLQALIAPPKPTPAVVAPPPEVDGPGIERLFTDGVDALDQHVRYRLERKLPTAELETWIAGHRTKATSAVLETLATRETSAGAWARRFIATGRSAPAAEVPPPVAPPEVAPEAAQ